jgi:uncharacterized membrane protein YesL
MLALRAVWQGMREVWYNGYTYIWANVAFIATSLFIITMPAAWSALCKVCHEAQTSPSNADLDLFWQTFKANFWRALPWGLAHLIFAVMNITNLLTYTASTDPITLILRAVWWGLGFVWIIVFITTWIFFYEMQAPTLIGATRNALIFVLQNPLQMLVILIIISVIGVISTVLVGLWFVLTIALIVAIYTSAVLMVIEAYRKTIDEG